MASEQEILRSRLQGLIGAGFCFSSVEDHDLAIQWAERAYKLGREDRATSIPHYSAEAVGRINTQKQQDTYDAIAVFCRDKGRYPTRKELAASLGCSYNSTVVRVETLQRLGVLLPMRMIRLPGVAYAKIIQRGHGNE